MLSPLSPSSVMFFFLYPPTCGGWVNTHHPAVKGPVLVTQIKSNATRCIIFDSRLGDPSPSSGPVFAAVKSLKSVEVGNKSARLRSGTMLYSYWAFSSPVCFCAAPNGVDCIHV